MDGPTPWLPTNSSSHKDIKYMVRAEILSHIAKKSTVSAGGTFICGGEFGIQSILAYGIPQALKTGDFQALNPFGGYTTWEAAINTTANGIDVSSYPIFHHYTAIAGLSIGMGEATIALLSVAAIAAGGAKVLTRLVNKRRS